jgi:hypothetical protein
VDKYNWLKQHEELVATYFQSHPPINFRSAVKKLKDLVGKRYSYEHVRIFFRDAGISHLIKKYRSIDSFSTDVQFEANTEKSLTTPFSDKLINTTGEKLYNESIPSNFQEVRSENSSHVTITSNSVDEAELESQLHKLIEENTLIISSKVLKSINQFFIDERNQPRILDHLVEVIVASQTKKKVNLSPLARILMQKVALRLYPLVDPLLYNVFRTYIINSLVCEKLPQIEELTALELEEWMKANPETLQQLASHSQRLLEDLQPALVNQLIFIHTLPILQALL